MLSSIPASRRRKYNSTAYHTLICLGAIGAVKLKTTDITPREVKAQIATKVAEGIKSLHAKSAKSGVLRNFMGYSELMERFAASKAETLATDLWERVEAQLKQANVEIKRFNYGRRTDFRCIFCPEAAIRDGRETEGIPGRLCACGS